MNVARQMIQRLIVSSSYDSRTARHLRHLSTMTLSAAGRVQLAERCLTDCCVVDCSLRRVLRLITKYTAVLQLCASNNRNDNRCTGKCRPCYANTQLWHVTLQQTGLTSLTCMKNIMPELELFTNAGTKIGKHIISW